MNRKKVLATCWLAALVAVLSGIPATAGTSGDPEITDVAGDANFINGQGLQPGHEAGPDTRPASVDGSDLLAVWFETAYTTTKVLDPSTGSVLRVEHRPTALLVHIRTQAPVRPMTPWSGLRYKVQATLPECRASFELQIYASNPALDHANLYVVTGQCGTHGPNTGPNIPVDPSFDGNVSTVTFPFGPEVSEIIWPGATIVQPEAHVFTERSVTAGGSDRVIPDQTAPGRTFTVGQDVPPDIDCTADPGNTECQP